MSLGTASQDQEVQRGQAARYLLLLFLVAFLIRFVAAVCLRDLSIGPTGSTSNDDVQFNLLAISLAEGNGYADLDGRPTSFRAPGFPLFLAGLYSVSGLNYGWAYAAFCLLGAANCLLVYAIARDLFPEPWARAAGMLSAVYPPHAYFATVFVSENVFIPLLTLGVWLFLRYVHASSSIALLGSGCAFGLATLTRPYALLLLPILFLLVVVHGDRAGRGRALALAVGFAIAFLAVISPWTIRNYHVHGQLVLVATNGGSTFYGGNNQRVLSEPVHWGYWISTVELPHRDRIDATPDEISHDNMEWQLGKAWLQEHWRSIPMLCVFKLGRLWIWPPSFDPNNRLMRLMAYAPFWILFSFGAFVSWTDRRFWTSSWCVMHAVMLATVLVAIIFWGCPRFRDANVGCLMMYTVLGLQSGVRVWLGPGRGSTGGTS